MLQRSQSYVVVRRDFLPSHKEDAIVGSCRYRTTKECDFPDSRFPVSITITTRPSEVL